MKITTVEYRGELPEGRLTRKKIIKMATEAIVQELTGEQMNVLYDNKNDSQEYKDAEALLSNHEKLVDLVYNNLMNLEYMQLGFMEGINTTKYLRFEGKDKIIPIIDNCLKQEGF